MTKIYDVNCHFCGRTVERRHEDFDYHKGYHTTGRDKVYPFEERTFKYPEGMKYGVIICQKCNDKPTSKWVHQLRIESVKNEIERTTKLIESKLRGITILHEDCNKLEKVQEKLNQYLGELAANVDYSGSWEDVKISKDLLDW